MRRLVHMATRIEPQLRTRLELFARTQGWTPSQAIRLAITAMLDSPMQFRTWFQQYIKSSSVLVSERVNAVDEDDEEVGNVSKRTNDRSNKEADENPEW